jgi:DNA invertase Pin-like site-specific DNA recombinase
VVDLADLLQRFERRRVALISVAEQLDTGSALGRLMLNIMVSVSQWEREAIGERTRDVMRHKKVKGERVGTLPFGFRLVAGSKTLLEPDPVEQDRLARLQELRATRSLRRVADAATAEGLTTRRGTPYRFQSVAKVLRRS